MTKTNINNIVGLKSLELCKDNIHAKAVFNSTDSMGNVWEIVVPRIEVPCVRKISIETDENIFYTIGNITINNCTYKLEKENDCFYTCEIIKKAEPKEMTIEEIEKELGHKVRIVNKKDEER